MSEWIRAIYDHGVERELKVSNVVGAGSEHFHVYVDNYYHGSIWNTEQFGWKNSIEHPAINQRMIDRIVELIKKGEIS